MRGLRIGEDSVLYVASFLQDFVDNYMTFLDKTQDDEDLDMRTDMVIMFTYEDY